MAPNSTFVGLPVIPPEDPSLNAASPKPRGIQTVFEAKEQAEVSNSNLLVLLYTANFTQGCWCNRQKVHWDP